MGSLGTGELIVIAIAALVVFGPKRLPELARKAGELLAKARTATRSLSDSLDGDYGEIAAPLQTLKSEYDATVKEIKNVGTTVTGLGTTLPGEDVDGKQLTVDSTEEEADSTEAVDGSQPTLDGEKTEDGSQLTVDSTEEEADSTEAVDGSQSTADGTEEGGTGTSDTVDRLPSTDDSSHTDDRDSSS